MRRKDARGRSAASRADQPLDPTRPKATRSASGTSRREPAVEATIRRAQGSLAGALWRRFCDADLMSQAAALAFNSLLSLAPLLLILLALTVHLVRGAQAALLQQIQSLIGTDARQVAQTILSNAASNQRGGAIAGAWSTGLLFVGATAVFAQLQEVLNRIFRTDATRLPGALAWLRKRVFSLGLVFALGFLLIVSMTVDTLLEYAFTNVRWMLPTVLAAVTWVIYALSFAFMYHYLPDRRVDWRHALGGGVLTALLFLFGRGAIAWYLQTSHPAAGYGSMGTLVLALVWMYYAALIVFLGAMVTAVVDERGKQARSR